MKACVVTPYFSGSLLQRRTCTTAISQKLRVVTPYFSGSLLQHVKTGHTNLNPSRIVLLHPTFPGHSSDAKNIRNTGASFVQLPHPTFTGHSSNETL